jgi:NAD(P)-dependent dehydrogenase (short-subunit alcohol dehydrogenase family)
VALAFAREGADIAISYLNEHEDAKETERWVKDAGRKCLLLPGDLVEEATCKSIVEQTVAAFGRLDLLVNNAAYQGKSVKSITELDRHRVEYTFKANIIAMFTIVSAALPHMSKGGAIINTGSVQAYDPSSEILDYATTKAAIVGFTKGLAQELVPKGIRVNCVAPGPVWTPLVMASFPAEKLKVRHTRRQQQQD